MGKITGDLATLTALLGADTVVTIETETPKKKYKKRKPKVQTAKKTRKARKPKVVEATA